LFVGVIKLHPHYDLVNKKRNFLCDKLGEKFIDKAIRFGALKITTRQLIKIVKSCYSFPTTEKEIEEFERRHKWALSQPLSEKDVAKLEKMRERIIGNVFPDDNNKNS